MDVLTNLDVKSCRNCREGFFRDRLALQGMVAAKTILAGRLIYPDLIRRASTIALRQKVDITYVSGALTITMRGEAMETGGAGDSIYVRNLDTGLIVSGVVNADGSVSASPR